jgi:hypothetical protein
MSAPSPAAEQNAAARLLTGKRRYDHITPVLASLHWLFKIKLKFTWGEHGVDWDKNSALAFSVQTSPLHYQH